MKKALKCRNPSLVIERLAFLNQRYIAMATMAESAGGNWHNLWMNFEESKPLMGSTTDIKSQQGGEYLIFYAFWFVLCNVTTMVAVKLLSIYQTWRIHEVLDVEKCQQEPEICPPGSTNHQVSSC